EAGSHPDNQRVPTSLYGYQSREGMLIQNNGTDTHFLYRRYHITEAFTKYILTFTFLLTPGAGNILGDEVLHF
ncbi:unnamed protein product, partial [Fusarium fujikuroi]